MRVEELEDGQALLVEFANRRQAEAAKSFGASFAGQQLNLNWHETNGTTQSKSAGEDSAQADATPVQEEGVGSNPTE